MPKFQNRGDARELAAAVICSIVILVVLGALPAVGASPGAMQMSVQGYGTVHGQLENSTIQPNGTVSMLMFVNDQMQTSQGTYPVSANGLWVGVRNGSALSGKIQGVAGKVQICVLICQDANFVGEGQWSGSLDGSNAAGNFNGTITFTNSPVQQIPVGQPIPAYGTWTSDFQSPVPEFASEIGTYTLVFMIVAFTLVILRSRQRNRSQNGLRQSQANLGRKFPRPNRDTLESDGKTRCEFLQDVKLMPLSTKSDLGISVDGYKILITHRAYLQISFAGGGTKRWLQPSSNS